MAPDRVYPDSSGSPAAPPPLEAYDDVNLDQQIGSSTAPPPPGAHYNMKDQQIPPPATYQERRRGRSPCCCCLTSLCAVFIVLQIILGLALLIFWLAVRPDAPQFAVQTVHISGLNLTSPVDTTIDYGIMVRNPNKKAGFYYSDINMKLEANGENVGKGSISDFYQGHKNTTYLNGEIDSQNVSLSSSTLTSLSQNQSHVPFYAEVDLKLRAKVGGLKTRKTKVKVKCDIRLDLTTVSGSQLKSWKCKVHW